MSQYDDDVAWDSRVELNMMFDALKRDAHQYFGMGGMRARKKLANGAVVTVTIKMPKTSGDTKGSAK